MASSATIIGSKCMITENRSGSIRTGSGEGRVSVVAVAGLGALVRGEGGGRPYRILLCKDLRIALDQRGQGHSAGLATHLVLEGFRLVFPVWVEREGPVECHVEQRLGGGFGVDVHFWVSVFWVGGVTEGEVRRVSDGAQARNGGVAPCTPMGFWACVQRRTIKRGGSPHPLGPIPPRPPTIPPTRS